MLFYAAGVAEMPEEEHGTVLSAEDLEAAADEEKHGPVRASSARTRMRFHNQS